MPGASMLEPAHVVSCFCSERTSSHYLYQAVQALWARYSSDAARVIYLPLALDAYMFFCITVSFGYAQDDEVVPRTYFVLQSM